MRKYRNPALLAAAMTLMALVTIAWALPTIFPTPPSFGGTAPCECVSMPTPVIPPTTPLWFQKLDHLTATTIPATTAPPPTSPPVAPTSTPVTTAPVVTPPATTPVTSVAPAGSSVLQEWTRVAVCEEGGWIGYAGPSYPDSLGINATNWNHYDGGSDMSPANQIRVGADIEAAAGHAGFVPDQNGCASW